MISRQRPPSHVQPRKVGGYVGYGENVNPPAVMGQQAVADAMLQQPGPPGVGNAQRDYANMLRGEVFDSGPKGIAEGIAQLGKAMLYRGANKKADQYDRDQTKTAESQRAAVTQALLGDDASPRMQALAQADLGGVVQAIMAKEMPSYGDETGRMALDHSVKTDARDFDRGVMESDRTHGFNAGEAVRNQENLDREYEYTVDQDEIENAARSRQLDISEMSATASMDAAAKEQAGVAPHLQNLPNGVQSRIVGEEFDVLEAAGARVEGARKGAQLAKKFMDESKGYNSLGGGVFNDLGQVFSNRTAGLKGITAEMIPMMRQAGEGIMTDADARRYEDAVVSINKPRGSNQNVSDSFAAAEQNAVANERFLRRFQAQNGYGSMGEGERLWAEYSDAHPIFDAETGQPNTDRIGIEQWLQGDQQHSPPVGPPEAAIQMLMQNPQLARSFDQKYGEGAADQYFGGQ